MSTATFTAASAVAATRGESQSTLFHRTLARLVAARQARAKRLVANHMAKFSVEDLRHLGYSDGQIAEFRAHRTDGQALDL